MLCVGSDSIRMKFRLGCFDYRIISTGGEKEQAGAWKMGEYPSGRRNHQAHQNGCA
jgi:hypothetical protein